MYEYYDDERIISEHYQGIKRYLAGLRSLVNGTGYVPLSLFGDWCSVARGPDPLMYCAYPSFMTSTFYYVVELEIMMNFARMLGFRADEKEFTRESLDIRNKWDANFYNGDTFHTYGDSYMTAQILALTLDIVPSNRREFIIAKLLHQIEEQRDTHATCGIVGTKYILPLLTKLGRVDVAYKLAVQTSYPSWGYWINQGATTLWESWSSSRYKADGSKNHIMFGSQGPWYYQVIGGLNQRHGTTGWKEIEVRPFAADIPLQSATFSILTHRGLIVSSWKKSEDSPQTPSSFFLNVSIPVNSVGSISMPTFSTEETGFIIKENDFVCWKDGHYIPGASGIFSAHQGGKFVVFSVGSGDFRFTFQRDK